MITKQDKPQTDVEIHNVRYAAAKSQEERWQREITGVTMCQFELAVKTRILGIFQHTDGFDLADKGDAGILARNIAIEMEKVLGIYPNLRPID